MPVQPKAQRYSVRDLQTEFPTEEACLEWLKDRRWPNGIFCRKCDRITKHHRIAARKSYSCDNCGHHVHPTAGTIFHKSSTDLTTWFHAIYLVSQTRCGISAMELMRQTNVTYKTAWRMLNEIRKLLAEETDPPLGGGSVGVEADETFIGGKPRQSERNALYRQGIVAQRGRNYQKHQTVFGVVERNGRVVAKVIPNTGGPLLRKMVQTYVIPKSMLFTDDYGGYATLEKKYYHRRIRHSARVYVEGDVHTQTIEGFFALVKNGIRGVYHSVSSKHLQSYLNEYAFRYSHRNEAQPMFKLVLASLIRNARPEPSAP